MPRPSQNTWLLLVALVAVAAGCKPKIGDECKISTDCSQAGDRLCDITAPGGYCTVYNCEPNTCPPDESVCIEFGEQRSPASDKCQDKQSPSPYGRAFCMAVCKKDSDCRSGYECQDLSVPGNPWAALVIDTDRGSKVCVVLVSAAQPPMGAAGAFGDVCTAELPSAAGGGTSAAGGSSSAGAAGEAAGGAAAAAGQGAGG